MASEVRAPGIYPRGFASLIEWPWPLVKAMDLVTLNYGKALLSTNRGFGKIPVYGTNGICGCHDKHLCSGPGVVLGRKGQGPLGVEWSETDFWVIDTAYYVTTKDDRLDLRYFYYLVKYIGLNHLKDGTSNPSLSRDTFAQLLLPLPPMSVQRSIAKFIGEIDQKIQVIHSTNDTLEKLGRAIFKSWFVDFDPVRAKAEGREPEGMDAATAAVFPSEFDDSQLGLIPKGWEARFIGELADVVGGSTPSTTKPVYWQDGEHFWATPKDLSNNDSPVLLGTERKVTTEGLASISSGLLPIGTVLLSSRAPIGYIALAQVPTAINQGFIALKPLEKMSSVFLLLWTEYAMDTIKSLANGSTFQEISKRNFRTIQLVRPGKATLSAFDSLAQPLYERITVNAKQVQTLTELRDALLPRLISSKLRVPDAEKMVEAVL